MLEKGISMLRCRSVTCVRINDELGIGQMLCEQEGIDRNDNDVLTSMHDESRLTNFVQHDVAIFSGYGAPFPDCVQLGIRRLWRNGDVAIRLSQLQALDIGPPRCLA